MKVGKAGREETTQSLVQGESSSACVSILTCASLTVVFIRQQNCASQDCPTIP